MELNQLHPFYIIQNGVQTTFHCLLQNVKLWLPTSEHPNLLRKFPDVQGKKELTITNSCL